MNIENIDLESILEKVKPYIIKVYGEEFIELIEERKKAIIPIFFETAEHKKTFLNSKISKKISEITISFLKRHNIDISSEVEKKVLENGSTFLLNDNAKAFLEAYFGTYKYTRSESLPIKSNSPISLRMMIPTFNYLGYQVTGDTLREWLETPEAKKAHIEIQEMKKEIEELDREYDTWFRDYAELAREVKEAEDIRRSLSEKYTLEFLRSISEYLPPEDKARLEDYDNSESKNFLNFKSALRSLPFIGDSLSCESGCIYAFGKRAEEILSDPNATKFAVTEIKKNRLNYFKMRGLYDGSPIETFLSSDIAKKNAPSVEYVEEIISKKEKAFEAFQNEFVRRTSTYERNIATIENANLLVDPEFEPQDMMHGPAFIQPSVTLKDGIPTSTVLLFFSPKRCLEGYLDICLIHEINHAIECTLLDYKDGTMTFKSGFETMNNHVTRDKRVYINFSEVVNQLIAIIIASEMHKDGVYLFDSPEKCSEIGSVQYENNLKFVVDFWNNFKRDIISARTGESLEELFVKIGRENFEKLNSIINEYSSHSSFDRLADMAVVGDTPFKRRTEKHVLDSKQVVNAMIERNKELGYKKAI